MGKMDQRPAKHPPHYYEIPPEVYISMEVINLGYLLLHVDTHADLPNGDAPLYLALREEDPDCA